MLITRFQLNLQIFIDQYFSIDIFTALQNFIVIKQKKAWSRRKYGDFQKMLSHPFIAEHVSLLTCKLEQGNPFSPLKE